MWPLIRMQSRGMDRILVLFGLIFCFVSLCNGVLQGL